MTQCPFCKGHVETRQVEHVHKWQGSMYILCNVPADVCTQCGEVFFGPEALQAMDAVVAQDIEPQSRRSLPVYSL